jgi:hypothetical protein
MYLVLYQVYQPSLPRMTRLLNNPQHLLIRAQLDELDQVMLQPIYQLSLWQEPAVANATTPYQAQLLDGAGNVVAEYPISLRYAEEAGITARSLIGTVPVSALDTVVATLRIIRQSENGPVILAEQWLNQRALTRTMQSELTETADSITLTWSYGSRPALVRYTNDDGSTWTTLAIDHLGGELSVDKVWLDGISPHERGIGRFEIILANGTNANVLIMER